MCTGTGHHRDCGKCAYYQKRKTVYNDFVTLHLKTSEYCLCFRSDGCILRGQCFRSITFSFVIPWAYVT